MKTLKIHNFRCFESLYVDFTPGVNLFIGDNASGKTSLLFGCKYAMNCFFSGFSDLYTKWVVPGRNDFRHFISGEKRFGSKPIDLSFSYFRNEMPASEDFHLNDSLEKLTIKNEKSRPLISPLTALRDYGKFLMKNQLMTSSDDDSFHQEYALPLYASFSTHGIHNKPKIVAKYFSEYGQTPSFGYYMCGATDGLLDHWIHRLLVLVEADKNPLEREIVISALKSMFGDNGCGIMRDFDVRVNYKDVICIFNDGREVPVAILSDGYKRLFSIVIDLAFRCALLNSLKFKEDTLKLTHGTVIIDEIDLHLHPSLQAVVLKALQKTFPNLQFIVSSHAPMVMSGVENSDRNCVQYLSYDTESKKYMITPVDTFGMDLSTLAEVVLKVPKRDPAVERALSQLSDKVDEEDYEKASILLEDMKNKFGSKIPELSGFETQISIEQAFR